MLGFLIDTNVWLAAAIEGHGSHAKAVEILGTATPAHPACFCRALEQSTLRLLSTPSIQSHYETGLISNQTAIGLLDAWRSRPGIICLDEPVGTRELWLRLADRGTASPKLWMDAYLAAFAISGGLALVTLDKDFCQFESAGLDLKLLNS